MLIFRLMIVNFIIIIIVVAAAVAVPIYMIYSHLIHIQTLEPLENDLKQTYTRIMQPSVKIILLSNCVSKSQTAMKLLEKNRKRFTKRKSLNVCAHELF